MIKVEVLRDTVLTVPKGTVITVSERQFELARAVLKPVVADKKKKTKAEEAEEK